MGSSSLGELNLFLCPVIVEVVRRLRGMLVPTRPPGKFMRSRNRIWLAEQHTTGRAVTGRILRQESGGWKPMK
jgi:hypothetical protein